MTEDILRELFAPNPAVLDVRVGCEAFYTPVGAIVCVTVFAAYDASDAALAGVHEAIMALGYAQGALPSVTIVRASTPLLPPAHPHRIGTPCGFRPTV